MCIRIIGQNTEAKYDSKRPLEEQLCGSEQIVIRYEPKDADIPKFVDEVERLCKTGISFNTNVNVVHNNHLKGAKAKKIMNKLMKDLNLNEAIKILVSLQSETDKTLESLSNFCQKR